MTMLKKWTLFYQTHKCLHVCSCTCVRLENLYNITVVLKSD